MHASIYCDRCGKTTTSNKEVMAFDGKKWLCIPSCGTVFITRPLAIEEAMKHPEAKVGRIILDNKGLIPLTYIEPDYQSD